MGLHNPPHPGGIIRDQCLAPLGLTITRAAQELDITRQSLSALVNERKGISPEMAGRLAKSFGSTPETWLGGVQEAYDQWQARNASSHRSRNPGCVPGAPLLASHIQSVIGKEWAILDLNQ
ncbi:MAG: HigA family addiction module antidote protein [Synechococcus sp. SB0665_bin_28]|nr:HigA family addiction module antidote protein [Synechococcus sp. SB0665_bin_28]MYF19518.1 HigA family addiction module antidote protein [Synechococcus sp. SB0677_bin_5]